MTKPIFTFVKAVTGDHDAIYNDLPQVGFIGRSNVGKSSVINTLANNKSLARSSSTAGRTRELNYFSVDKKWYLVDLPGYGYAKASHSVRDMLKRRIAWYLFEADVAQQKIVLIVDAKVGPTKDDIEIYGMLLEAQKDFIIVANKIDKLPRSQQVKSIKEISELFPQHLVIPFSSETKVGVTELLTAITPA